jgi:S1-C subfamily serine protease
MPLKSDPKRAAYTLVTAAHVLDEIGGDMATVQMRTRTEEATYRTFNYNLPIRASGRPLYTKHPTADVAVMYVNLPDNVPINLLATEFLADDARLSDIELHPGDEAFCLGFPLAASTPGGFPILRTGRIASYPITPAAKVKSIVFDLFLYPGNSGGPVYYIFDNRVMKGGTNIGRWQGILGLVIQQANSALPEFLDKPLNLGVIVPAYFIKETLNQLPDPPTK